VSLPKTSSDLLRLVRGVGEVVDRCGSWWPVRGPAGFVRHDVRLCSCDLAT
jgi:hypothetical protein